MGAMRTKTGSSCGKHRTMVNPLVPQGNSLQRASTNVSQIRYWSHGEMKNDIDLARDQAK